MLPTNPLSEARTVDVAARLELSHHGTEAALQELAAQNALIQIKPGLLVTLTRPPAASTRERGSTGRAPRGAWGSAGETRESVTRHPAPCALRTTPDEPLDSRRRELPRGSPVSG